MLTRSAHNVVGNLPELIAFWRAKGEEHYLIISAPDERYVQMLVTDDGEVVCEVVADRFLAPECRWNDHQLELLRRHFVEPAGAAKSSPNWFFASQAPEATMEVSLKVSLALYEVLRLRPETQVALTIH